MRFIFKFHKLFTAPVRYRMIYYSLLFYSNPSYTDGMPYNLYFEYAEDAEKMQASREKTAQNSPNLTVQWSNFKCLLKCIKEKNWHLHNFLQILYISIETKINIQNSEDEIYCVRNRGKGTLTAEIGGIVFTCNWIYWPHPKKDEENGLGIYVKQIF